MTASLPASLPVHGKKDRQAAAYRLRSKVKGRRWEKRRQERRKERLKGMKEREKGMERAWEGNEDGTARMWRTQRKGDQRTIWQSAGPFQHKKAGMARVQGVTEKGRQAGSFLIQFLDQRSGQ